MEGALVFLHGSVQVLGLFIELPQGRAGLQCGVLLLVVNVERLCLGYLDLIAVLEKREREAYYYTVQRMPRFGISTVTQFQLGQPALLACRNLFPGGRTFTLQGLQGGV